ncbi:MAG: HAD family phosphatase [Lachnospiraceae bacterium]|nr:HAD family phosphatase [Lachnospiraceae bacterium]
MRITTIIFDIGNVLTDFYWERHFNNFGFSSEVFEKVANATTRSKAWGEFDRGISEEEVLSMFIKNDPSVEKEIRMMFSNIADTIRVYDTTIPWIMDLKKKGYQVLVLSNLSNKTLCECAKEFQFLNYVDGGILSFRDGVVKPEPEIYQLLIDRYFFQPQESIFLDDRVENVEAAQKFGINGIVFKNREQALLELKAFNVE